MIRRNVPLAGCGHAFAQHSFALNVDELDGCRLVLCAHDAESARFFASIQELAESVVEIQEIKGRENLLLQELAASWETLAALYENSLDMQSSDNLQTVIDRLLDRAVVAGPDVAAFLWVLEGDKFQVKAERRCPQPEPRTGLAGLLGAARRSAAPMVLDANSEEVVDTEFEPELREAGPIVLIPVRTRQGLEAVLQVWRQSDSPPFESPAVRLLEAIALQAANAIENDRLHCAALEGERMRQEINIGASIQQHLLLGEHPQDLAGVEITKYMLPSLEVSGDFYQFVRHSDTCFDAVVGDVMGKGIGAALMGAATKSTLLRVLAEAKGGGDRIPQPAAIVTATNQSMCAQLMQLNSFVTLFYARFDLVENTLTYVDAGHGQALHCMGQSGTSEPLVGEESPLGFTDTEIYAQSVVPLGPGDIVLIYSDGMSEATNAAGEFYGAERVRLFLESNAWRKGSDLAARISQEVIAFRGSHKLDDDLTYLVIKMDGEGKGRQRCYKTIDGSLDELENLRTWLAATLDAELAIGLSEGTLFNLQLAVQEAATNIIFHGLLPDSSRQIAVTVHCEGPKLEIQLSYEGVPFSPENVPPPSFDGSRDHGFGLFLIDQLMDEVAYGHRNGRNTVSLTKHIGSIEEHS